MVQAIGRWWGPRFLFSPISLECKLLLSINDMRARLPARFTFHLTPIHPFIYCYSSNGTFSFSLQFSLVQSLSLVWLYATPWTTVHQASLSITNSQSLLKLMSIKSVMPSNHLVLCHPLLLPPSVFPRIRIFSNESVLIRWSKYWNFSFSISPSNNIQDWFPLGWTGWISLQSKGFSRVFSNTTVQKHQFFSAQLSL